jgi:hypothetical protein
VRPSPPLLRHAAHCYNCSDAIEHAGTGRCHTCYCTSYGSLSTAPSSPPEDAPVNHHATILKVAPVQVQDTPRRHDWSKIRQDGRQLCSAIRHTATRVEIVRHACNLLPSWPIKGGAAPPAAGEGHETTDTRRRTRDDRHETTDNKRSHAFHFSHDIGTRLNHIFWDLEATPPLPPHL